MKPSEAGGGNSVRTTFRVGDELGERARGKMRERTRGRKERKAQE